MSSQREGGTPGMTLKGLEDGTRDVDKGSKQNVAETSVVFF